MHIIAAIHNCFGILQIMKHHTKNTTHHQNSASITKFCQQDFVLKSVVIEGKKGISGRICFSEVLRNFIRYFQAPSKFLKFDSEKSFSQNQSVFSAIFLKVPSSFGDLYEVCPRGEFFSKKSYFCTTPKKGLAQESRYAKDSNISARTPKKAFFPRLIWSNPNRKS